MTPLYINKSSVGSNKDLLPTFNILLRMFRSNIAPQAGNVDAIRGGLVNLLIHSHAVLLAGVNCQGYEIDVMDFIKCELHWAVHEMKNPIYAPFVMKLILDQVPNLNRELLTVHKAGSLQILKHDKPSSSSAPSRVPFASSEEEEEDVAPVRRRSKNADPPSWVSKGKDDVQRRVKKLSWFEKMVLRMNVCLHKEHYQGYKERKIIISNQNKLFKELEKNRDKTPPPPPPPPRIGKATGDELLEESSGSEKTISYDAWHAKQFPWSDFDIEEVSSMPSSSRDTGQLTYELRYSLNIILS